MNIEWGTYRQPARPHDVERLLPLSRRYAQDAGRTGDQTGLRELSLDRVSRSEGESESWQSDGAAFTSFRPTTWYIERTVWLIAGIVLLAATALAAFVHPLFVLGVIATGRVSIGVALTGFCAVGNIAAAAWLRIAAGCEESPAASASTSCRPTTGILERRIYVAVGINIIDRVGTVAGATAHGGCASPVSSVARWSGSPPRASASWPTGCTGSAPSRASRRRRTKRSRRELGDKFQRKAAFSFRLSTFGFGGRLKAAADRR